MKVTGIPVGTTMPRADWNQNDPRKADYIKNKPDVAGHTEDINNPHKVTAEQLGIDVDNLCKKNAVYTATKDNLVEVISKADAGATVHLLAGNYPLLTFTGEYGLSRAETDNPLQGTVMKYPENLTIVGGEGVTVAGISITSGVIDSKVDSPHAGEYKRTQDSANADISNAILPSGLTFNGINFTNHFSLRNACVDNLSIIGCTFAEGMYLYCGANHMTDFYGTDRISGAFTWRNTFAELMPRNMLVRDCTFSNVFGKNFNNDACSAILIRGVDGIVVHRNRINGAEHNGVQIGGSVGRDTRSTGKIAVTNNTISNTGYNCINVHSVDNAEVFVINNVVNTEETVHIRVDTSVTNTVVTCTGNRHKAGSSGTRISEDKISIVVTTTPAIESTEYPGCYYRTVNGETEWINPPMLPGVEFRTTERSEGKPVYAKRISYAPGTTLGNVGSNTDTSIAHGIVNFNYLVRCSGRHATYSLPELTMTNGTVSINQVDKSAIVLRHLNTVTSATTWYFDLYYTKTTD